MTIATTSTVPAIDGISQGSVVAVTQPDGSTAPMYFEAPDPSDRARLFTGYTMTPSLGLQDYRTGMDFSNVTAVLSTDFYAFQRIHKYSQAAGHFIKVPVSRLPDSFTAAALEKTGHSPSRYHTWAEILSVTTEGDTTSAELRVFTHNTETPEGREYGTLTVENFQQWDAAVMSRARFEQTETLAADRWTVGKLYYIQAELFICESVAGVSGIFAPLDDETGQPKQAADKVTKLSEEFRNVVFAADDVAAYVATLPSEDVKKSLMLLSRNTVTRALKHADSNDYCSETAVALTSAGHQLPELVVKGTITIEVDIRSKEYMLLRRLFGKSNSDVSDIDSVLQANWSRMADYLPGLPNRLPAGAKVDVQAELDWKAPKLRPLA